MGGAAINGGFVVRDLTVPSLTARYVYTDSSGALGTTIHAIDLTPTGASGDAAIPGLSAGGVVSFGEDACGHVYVAEISGTVSRIEPSGGTTACNPQVSLDQDPVRGPDTPTDTVAQTAATDSKPPGLQLSARRARRSAARGEARVLVSCDEACTVQGTGRIGLPGKDVRLDPDSGVLAAGSPGILELALSAAEAKRLLAALADGDKAKAVLVVEAEDAAGNDARGVRKVRQKP